MTARQSSKPSPFDEGTAEMLAERGVTLIGSPSPPRSRVTIPAGEVIAKSATVPPSSTATLPGSATTSCTTTIAAAQRGRTVAAPVSSEPTRGTTPAVGTKLVAPTDTTVIAPTDRVAASRSPSAAGSDAAMRTSESSGAHHDAAASQSGVDRTMLMPAQGISAVHTDLMLTQPSVLKTEIRPLTPEEQGLLVTQRTPTTGGAALLSEPADVAPTRRMPLWIPLLVVLALAAAGAAAVTFLWPRGTKVGAAPADTARQADDASVPAAVRSDDRDRADASAADDSSAPADPSGDHGANDADPSAVAHGDGDGERGANDADPNAAAEAAGDGEDERGDNDADPSADANADDGHGERGANDADPAAAANDAADADGTPDDPSHEPARPRSSSSSSSSKKPRDRTPTKRGEPEPDPVLPGFRPGRPVPP